MNGKQISMHIVAGFLGAGKTTFINKLFADGIDPRSTVLIENELGEASIDDALLQAQDLEVRTLTSGCVCCSLRGDLADTIETVVSKYAPQTILIEPTGVASPNELIRICANDLWNLPICVESVVTIVNAQTIEELLDLDIGVFDAQLNQARLVLFSRTQYMEPDKVARARHVLWENVGWQVPVLDAPWNELDALEVLGVAQEAFTASEHAHSHGCEHGHGQSREHAHSHGCEHGHGQSREHAHSHGCDGEKHVHHAAGIESRVIFPDHAFDDLGLEELKEELESGSGGLVLRAKGFVRGVDAQMLHIEYVYGNMQVSPTVYEGDPKLVIISKT